MKILPQFFPIRLAGTVAAVLVVLVIATLWFVLLQSVLREPKALFSVIMLYAIKIVMSLLLAAISLLALTFLIIATTQLVKSFRRA